VFGWSALFTSEFSGNIALVLNVRNCHGLLLFVSLINIFFFSGVSTLETFGENFQITPSLHYSDSRSLASAVSSFNRGGWKKRCVTRISYSVGSCDKFADHFTGFEAVWGQQIFTLLHGLRYHRCTRHHQLDSTVLGAYSVTITRPWSMWPFRQN